MELEMLELFRDRAAIIIDDELKDNARRKDTGIWRIKKDIENLGFDVITYSTVPDETRRERFKNASFLILDWDLLENKIEGVIPDELRRDSQEELMDFIKYLVENHLLPIFLFTKEKIDYVKDELKKDTNIDHAIRLGQIVISSKSKINTKSFVKVFDKWVKSNPAIYVMKKLEQCMDEARIGLFREMIKVDQCWPAVVVSALRKDGSEDINHELTEFITSSLYARIEAPKYEYEIISKEATVKDDELIKLYSNSKLVTYKTNLSVAYTGDLYVNAKKKEFYLNITPECDLRGEKYLLLHGRASKCDYHDTFGIIQKSVSHCVPCLGDHGIIEFAFKSYMISRPDEEINQMILPNSKGEEEEFIRFGRLLHPYITEIQERFGHYISRHGNIRHPDFLIKRYSRDNDKSSSSV